MTVRPKSRDDVMVKQAHGRTVLLRMSDGGYYTLDEVGAFIWSRCDGRHTVDELVGTVLREFDAPPDVVRADTVAFIKELGDEELLVAAA